MSDLSNEKMQQGSVVLILGAPTDAEGKVGKHLRERCDRALQLNPHILIISGGAPKSYGSSGLRPEAEAAAEYVAEKGFRGRILLDSHALHTLHNFSLTLPLLPEACKHVSVVTHDWHTPRSKALAEGVYGAAGIQTDFISIASDASETETAERIQTEKRLLETWVPGALAQWRMQADKRK